MMNGSEALNGSKRSAPEDRSPLRKLHSQIQAAELSGETDTVLELLERAPVAYRAAYALVSFLPRMLLDEPAADDSEYEARPGDVPSSELDAIEAEEAEEDGFGNDSVEQTDGEDVTDDEQPIASETDDSAEPRVLAEFRVTGEPPTTRALGVMRRSLLAAVRAEQSAFTRMWKADHRAGRLETAAAEASAALNEASQAAISAAARSEQLYGAARNAVSDRGATDSASASMLAERAAERFQTLAEAEAEAAAVGRRVIHARESAAHAREEILSRIRDTHRVLQRASDVYFAYLASAARSHGGTGNERRPSAPVAAHDSEDSEEPHALQGTLRSEEFDSERSTRGVPESSLPRKCAPAATSSRAPLGASSAAVIAAPTIEGVAQLANEELLELATDWSLRDRVQTWYVCDRQHPAPPCVFARQLVILECQWRIRHAQAPDGFEQSMNLFERNQGGRRARLGAPSQEAG